MKSLSALAIAAALPGVCFGQDGQRSDLNDLNIEDLMKVEVVTASRTAELLKDVAGALYVLSDEEIRRSGAKHLPDMLRLIPGVNVAQLDANKWMVSIRGLNSRFSNKLQVLVDGRSVYSPVFSGVFWDTLNFTPDQIDRIEVIRGPGGALWGANAVNGIINIITKSAADTQGGAMSVSMGDQSLSDICARYGWSTGQAASWRVSARTERYRDTDGGGVSPQDGYDQVRFDVRGDLKPSERDKLMLSGSVISEHLGGTYTQDNLIPPLVTNRILRHRSANWSAQGEWSHEYSERDLAQYRFSLARTSQNPPEMDINSTTLDLGYQRVLGSANSQRFIYGAGFRQVNDEIRLGTLGFSVVPTKRSSTSWTAYGHYEKQLNAATKLSVGALLEGNSGIGIEIQPSVRVLTALSQTSSLWFAASRAVRTPSRVDRDGILPGTVQPTVPLVTQAVLNGNKDFSSESVVTLEAGYRSQTSERLMLDVVGYVSRYKDLRTFEPIGGSLSATPVPHGVLNVQFQNKLKAETAGIEVLAAFQASSVWQLKGTLTVASNRFTLSPSSTDIFGPVGAERSGSSPNLQAGLQSFLNLGSRFTWDSQAIYTGPIGGGSTNTVGSYVRVDSRLAWRPKPDFEVSLVGQNLLQKSHLEGINVLNSNPTKIRRSFYVQLLWKF